MMKCVPHRVYSILNLSFLGDSCDGSPLVWWLFLFFFWGGSLGSHFIVSFNDLSSLETYLRCWLMNLKRDFKEMRFMILFSLSLDKWLIFFRIYDKFGYRYYPPLQKNIILKSYGSNPTNYCILLPVCELKIGETVSISSFCLLVLIIPMWLF